MPSTQGNRNKNKDLYEIEKHKDTIINLEGFGQKSYDNFIKALNESKNIKLANFINALGIQNIGLASAKLLSKRFLNLENLMNATLDDINGIEGFGNIMAQNVVDYFENERLKDMTLKLSKYMNVEEDKKIDNIFSKISGLTFVITGEVNHFSNRDELKEKIESLGGKTSTSVSTKTNYLINNDINSTSSKNKKAKELNVPIITEDEFLKMIEE